MYGVNPVAIVAKAVWGIANSVAGMVGLTALELVLAIAALFVLSILVQLALVLTAKRGWSLDASKGGGRVDR